MIPFQPKRVLFAADYVGGLRDYVAERRPDLELRTKRLAEVEAADLAWAEVFVGFRKPALPDWGRIRWIHSIGAGVDGLVFEKDFPAGVILTKSGEDFGPAIGEWCVARALAVTQQLAALAEAQRARRWEREREPTMLRGQRVLVLGTGQVGSGIARAFRAMGCRVTGLSRTGRAAEGFDAVHPVAEFAARIHEAEWLVLAAPLTAETKGFLSRDRLAQCHGVYLMNVGRGALVDESALGDALDRGWLRGAALDVFAREPLPADSPLWSHPKVTVSPHVSGPSTLAATAEGFLESLAAVERGERPRLLVEPGRGY